MHLMLSNALCFAENPACLLAVADVPFHDQFDQTLLGIGLVLLVVWMLRRAIHPRKLRLTNATGRPNVIHPAHVLLLIVIWAIAGTAATELLKYAMPDAASQRSILAGIIGHAVWLAGSLLVASATFRTGTASGLGLNLRHWRWDAARGVLAYLIIYPICRGLRAVTVWLLPANLVHEHDMLTMLSQLSPAWKIGVLVSAVVFAPLAEEVFFRGLMQSMLRRYVKSAWVAILISAAIFAAFHVPYLQDLPALFALGIALGYNYERSGRLTAPILMHAIFNAVTLTLHFMT